MAKQSVDPRIPPDQQYFRIGEAAKIAEVEPYVLRFWETEFKVLKPSKSDTNRRQYSRRDLHTVLRIRDLLYEDGYTIAGARRRLKNRTGAVAQVPARTRSVVQRVRNEVEELLQLVED